MLAKNMFNKLSKQQCIELLNKEDFKRKTISFYRYADIENPQKIRDELYNDWIKLKVLGRIYLSTEGINAQLSVPVHNFKEFSLQLEKYIFFKDIKFKIAIEDDGRSFFKLTIKVRNQIVADGLPKNEYDVTNVGKHLDAHEWNKAIEDGAVIVDMRNHYESEIGRFKGAICPDVETFKEELPKTKKNPERKGRKNRFYCIAQAESV